MLPVTESKQVGIKQRIGSLPKKMLFLIFKPLANNYILLQPGAKARANRVNLNYWSELPNLGDAISPVVVEHILNSRGLTLDTEIDGTKHLCAIGSVITAGAQDCTIWGSGILNPKLLYRVEKRRLDIRAVRGPVTRALLLEYGYEVPAVYGDPAVFMPEIYMPDNARKVAKYGLIIHKDGSKRFFDTEKLDGNYINIDIKTDDYHHFIDEITSVEIVVSTSLHGVILAEAYGVPAILMMPNCDFMKYEDWYESTGRSKHPVAHSLSEVSYLAPPEIPNLKTMREELLSAFPFDLFQ